MLAVSIIFSIKFPVLFKLWSQFVFNCSDIANIFIRTKIQYERTDFCPKKMIRTTGSHRSKSVKIFRIDEFKNPFVISKMTDPPESPLKGGRRIDCTETAKYWSECGCF